MESYTILAEAARYGVPAVAIRAISDTVDFDMPYDFESARDAQGQIRVMSIVVAGAAQAVRIACVVDIGARLPDSLRGAWRIFWTPLRERLADRLIPVEQDSVAAL